MGPVSGRHIYHITSGSLERHVLDGIILHLNLQLFAKIFKKLNKLTDFYINSQIFVKLELFNYFINKL